MLMLKKQEALGCCIFFLKMAGKASCCMAYGVGLPGQLCARKG